MMHSVYLSELQKHKYTLVQNDADLQHVLDFTGLPKMYHKDITGAIVLLGNGDYSAIWLTESNTPYGLDSRYHPLPYYRPSSWAKSKLPSYWLESNPEYN